MKQNNDNESKQLSFPIQKIEYDDYSVSETQLIQTVRLDAAKLLNSIAAGKMILDEEAYSALKIVNGILTENGHPAIISSEELEALR